MDGKGMRNGRNGGHTTLELTSVGWNPKITEVLECSTNQQEGDSRIENASPGDVESQSRSPLKPEERENMVINGSSRGAKRSFLRRLRGWQLKKGKQNKDELSEKRNAMMVVAVLIATVTYQAALNPPGGFWQENKVSGSAYSSTTPAPSPAEDDGHIAGTAINNNILGFQWFLIANIVGLFASLIIILLLSSVITIKRSFLMWVLMIIMWVSVFSVAFSFLCGVIIILSRRTDDQALNYIVIFAIACVVLLVLLLVVHVVVGVRRIFRRVKNEQPRHEENVTNEAHV